ncbi:Flagellar sensor histidine kinase FleS [Labilithrix luteola]|uniref:histidine kinase n=1 Tax=Labilithrix luteola TaxID=1391654 RepID=A0A0K1Q958_9BACT|nr:histidine kinase dimerization/phospho-acceptor domain-containing protein [Labilithrix luteola]AKV02263.1 Flagellar sensor histidine kinase FleS [Labilithrix luteola]
MNLPAALSLTAATVAIVAAILAFGLSSAPAWRELRWFGLCALTGAAYELAAVPITLDVSARTIALSAYAGNFAAALHVACWFKYFAARQGRVTALFERAAMAGCVAIGVTGVVPGFLVQPDRVHVRWVPWLSTAYVGAERTAIGHAVLPYFAGALVILFVQSAYRWAKGAPGASSFTIGLAFVLVGAVSDTLAFTGLTTAPDVLGISLLLLVLFGGGTIASRFIAHARALEASTASLALTQTELVKRERLAAVGELAATVAHEVKEPLTHIFRTIGELRALPPGSPEQDPLLTTIQREAERQRDMVKELLAFARPRAPVFAPADVCEIASAAIETARRATDAAHDDVTLHCKTASVLVECDEQMLRQCLVELITNGLVADGRTRPVRVDVALRGDEVVFTIAGNARSSASDSGATRSLASHAKRLGLAIAKRVADTHGGTLESSSTTSDGASELVLPRTPR